MKIVKNIEKVNENLGKISDKEAEDAFKTILKWIGEDPSREGLVETPRRVIKAFKEYFKGYSQDSTAELQKTFGDVASVVDNDSNQKNKKIITNYFTKNDDRINFIFTSDYKDLADRYTSTGGAYSDQDLPDVTQFQTFQAWLSSAVGGAAVDISSFEKVESEKPNNSPVLEQEDPQDTADECHSNYPQRNSYLEHVDAQKALMRRYINSSLSGEDLLMLSYTHEGVNNIKMSDVLIKTPFKSTALER